MRLQYLDFDFSEDEHGHGSFDAMAAVAPAQLPALQAEIEDVLAWAEQQFGPPAPLDEGGEWDCELQGAQEVATPLAVRYESGRLRLAPGGPETPRTTLTLTLSGGPPFCAALRARFGLD
jgi:hypothetical protein